MNDIDVINDILAAILKKSKNQSCVLIWNGEKCDRKWFSVIQNGRRQPFWERKKKLRISPYIHPFIYHKQSTPLMTFECIQASVL